jgi:hypothetical protein
MDNPGLAGLPLRHSDIPQHIPSDADADACFFLTYEKHPAPYPSPEQSDSSSVAMAGADPKKLNSSSATATGVDPSQLPPPEELPPALQKIIDKADKEENFYDELWEGS